MLIPGFSEADWKDFLFNPKRLEKMQEGASIIRSFLQLVLSNGLLTGNVLAEENLNELSTRLVDTQIPSAARKVKSLAKLQLDSDSLSLIRFELTNLGNLAHLLQNFNKLSLMSKLNVWQYCGGIIPKEKILNQSGFSDKWTVRYVNISREDSLVARKTWFHGFNSRFWVYTIDYSFGNQPLPPGYKIGKVAEFVARFYPGLIPGRILETNNFSNTFPPVKLELDFNSITMMNGWIAKAFNNDPLINEFVVQLVDVRMMVNQEQFYIVDNDRKWIEISTVDTSSFFNKDILWAMYAEYGGRSQSISLMFSKGRFYFLN